MEASCCCGAARRPSTCAARHDVITMPLVSRRNSQWTRVMESGRHLLALLAIRAGQAVSSHDFVCNSWRQTVLCQRRQAQAGSYCWS